jgi:LPS sulfotransferase NodH
MATYPGYVIATHPRSGSNYFCQLLSSTGVLGRPDEFFTSGYLVNEGLDPADPASLEETMRRFETNSLTGNGIRAVKLFWFDVQPLARVGLLDRFNGLAWVRLERNDKLAQAVSVSRALRTGNLTSQMTKAETDLSFDYADIRLRLQRLRRMEQQWQGFFDHAGITPLEVRYEDVSADPQHQVDRLATVLGIEGGATIDPELVSLRVQRDAVNFDWAARFREQAEREEPELVQLFGTPTA